MTLLRAYMDMPADPSTLVDLNDYFTGDGVETDFTQTNKLFIRTGETVQSEDTFWSRYNGGVTGSGSGLSLSSAPADGAMIIVPGINKIQVRAFDQNVVEGDPSPRVKQYPFYVAPESVSDIVLFKYIPSPGKSDIEVQLLDKDTGYGASLGWFEIAPALGDGTPGTYQSAASALEQTSLEAKDNSSGAIILGDTSITVADGSQFTEGRYLVIDPGTVDEDQVRITDIVGNVLTTTPTAFAHADNSLVYEFAFKVWLRVTIPINASGGVPINLYEIAAKLISSSESRI